MTALVLPGPLTGAEPGAWFEYNCRVVSWTVPTPGVWHRNSWVFAWFEVKERNAWYGDALWFGGQRRHGDITSIRTGFTDRGREAMSREVLPVIARYGFDRLWMELRQVKAAAERFDRPIREAEAAVEWWRMKQDLAGWMAAGDLTFEPVRDAREHRIRVCCSYRQYDYKAAGARAMLDGAHVGWMTRDGELVPKDAILDTTTLGV